jgi:hypothetical protein
VSLIAACPFKINATTDATFCFGRSRAGLRLDEPRKKVIDENDRYTRKAWSQAGVALAECPFATDAFTSYMADALDCNQPQLV